MERTRRYSASRTGSSFPSWRFHIRRDSRESSAFEFSVGTAPGNDLVLTDGTVSRHHCAIIATPDGFLLRDLQSTNGTILGEHRIQSAFLRPLAVIRVGRTAMVFESVNGDVCEPLADQDRFGSMVGASAAIRRIFALLPRIAASGSTILVMLPGTGERYLSTPLFGDNGADMSEEELTISNSTPSNRLPPKAA